LKIDDKGRSVAVFIGIFSGLISLIFFPALFKSVMSNLIYEGKYFTEWNIIYLDTSIEIVKEINPLIILILLFSPAIFSMFAIEISGIYIKLRKDFFSKTIGILFQLIQITYILILIIYFALNGIFNLVPESEVSQFLVILDFSFEKKMISLFVTILIPFTYTSFALNRIKNYISESKKES
jgi:hypothetical protein